jgi:hypothetical protein
MIALLAHAARRRRWPAREKSMSIQNFSRQNPGPCAAGVEAGRRRRLAAARHDPSRADKLHTVFVAGQTILLALIAEFVCVPGSPYLNQP